MSGLGICRRTIVVLVTVTVPSCLGAAHLSQPGSWRVEAARGKEALESREIEAAQQHFQNAFQQAEKEGVPAHDLAHLLVLLGKAHWAGGDARLAAQTHRQALAMLGERGVSSESQLLRAEALTELGNLSFPLREPQAGVEALEEALRLRRELPESTSSELIESLILLGTAYELTGELTPAGALFREAADLLADSTIATGEERAGPLYSLAGVLERQGREEEARAVVEEAERLKAAGTEP